MFKDVIYECESPEDVFAAEKIAKTYGWDWEIQDRLDVKYGDINQCKWLIYSINLETNMKVNFWQKSSRNKEELIRWISTGGDKNPIFPENLLELRKILSGGKFIDYNSPKKLVYESNDIQVIKYTDFTNFDNIEYRKGSKEYGGILIKLLEFLRIYKTNDSDTLEFKIKDFETKSKMTIDEIKKLIESKENGQKLFDFNITIENGKLIISNLNKIGKNRPFESNNY